MMPEGTQGVYSYFEARKGARFPEMVFFGLQYIIKRFLTGRVLNGDDIELASELCAAHFGNDKYFNRDGWERVLNKHSGRLPIRIKAVLEGSVLPIDNVLMTVENTDDELPFLTNHLETILSQVWYPCTVATLSREVKRINKHYLDTTSDGGMLDFMLHDFGFRGTSSYDSAGIGGAAHLVNHLGTDTLAAMEVLMKFYGATLKGLAYSVAATEHSVMTALGREGERKVVENLLDRYPSGILSVVSDSYDIYRFVDYLLGEVFKQRILAREGVFVTRPDSVSAVHATPEEQMVWIAVSLWKNFGGTTNSKGFKVINPKIRMLWGDGIDIDGIERILMALAAAGFAAENVATFGMGGGLLQKINRDTQRFAFKSSAQKRNGVWHDIFKQPADLSKTSKKGRLMLISDNGFSHRLITVKEGEAPVETDKLVTVFENGELLVDQNINDIRERAKL